MRKVALRPNSGPPQVGPRAFQFAGPFSAAPLLSGKSVLRGNMGQREDVIGAESDYMPYKAS